MLVTLSSYSVIIPLGIDGLFHLNVTVFIVGVEIKFCGPSSGSVKIKRKGTKNNGGLQKKKTNNQQSFNSNSVKLMCIHVCENLQLLVHVHAQ